jgi:hypothetical protein
MRRIACGAAVVLALASGTAVAQGVQPGGPVYNSTGTGSGLGGVVGGTGPTWPNGTNPAPQPVIPSVPPGGSPGPGAPSTSAPHSTYVGPSVRPSPYPRPNEPFITSRIRPPATIPLEVPEQPNGSLGFLKGCWRSDIFPFGQHHGTITWCFDDKGGGRYLFTRTDQVNFYCHAQATAKWSDRALGLQSSKPACDDGSADAPAELTCRSGSDGAICAGPAGENWKVRLYRVR